MHNFNEKQKRSMTWCVPIAESYYLDKNKFDLIQLTGNIEASLFNFHDHSQLFTEKRLFFHTGSFLIPTPKSFTSQRASVAPLTRIRFWVDFDRVNTHRDISLFAMLALHRRKWTTLHFFARPNRPGNKERGRFVKRAHYSQNPSEWNSK